MGKLKEKIIYVEEDANEKNYRIEIIKHADGRTESRKIYEGERDYELQAKK